MLWALAGSQRHSTPKNMSSAISLAKIHITITSYANCFITSTSKPTFTLLKKEE